MLNNVLSGDKWLLTTGGSSSLPYVPINPSNPIQGMMRVNNSYIEVFTGSGWQMISNITTSISMSHRAQEIMNWADEKMKTEQDIMKVIETNPTVADAYATYKNAEEKLVMVMTLSQEESK